MFIPIQRELDLVLKAHRAKFHSADRFQRANSSADRCLGTRDLIQFGAWRPVLLIRGSGRVSLQEQYLA